MYRKLLKYLLFISLLVASACQGDKEDENTGTTPATVDEDEKSATRDENADTTPVTVEEKKIPLFPNAS